ncbi:MAG: 2-amino-4-hydroxy-6-hydroxymethyldihydropteridine diphosphokinase [FCB group bacterium]|nr:2-amino-4-hydroxy-6-hydroxymethyldihydropteridine diphosphokinase [FCB group bacterium]
MSEPTFLSLGSNLGDRESNLASAISALGTYPEIHDLTSASFYESEPIGNPDQPPYLNTVVEYQIDFSPEYLLEITQHTEEMLGRPRHHEHHGPRVIDIDILCCGSQIISTDSLKIPHPEMAVRNFVLIPFAEIAPDFIVPGWNRPVKYLLDRCPDTSRVYKHLIQKNA